MAVLAQEVATEPTAEDVRETVAGDSARPHQRDQRHELDLPLAGGDATQDHRELARGDQTDPRAGLDERHHADERVRPRPERPAEVADHVFEVRRLDQTGADRDERKRGDHHQRAYRGGEAPLAGENAGQQQSPADQRQRLHAPESRAALAVRPVRAR